MHNVIVIWYPWARMENPIGLSSSSWSISTIFPGRSSSSQVADLGYKMSPCLVLKCYLRKTDSWEERLSSLENLWSQPEMCRRSEHWYSVRFFCCNDSTERERRRRVSLIVLLVATAEPPPSLPHLEFSVFWSHNLRQSYLVFFVFSLIYLSPDLEFLNRNVFLPDKFYQNSKL